MKRMASYFARIANLLAFKTLTCISEITSSLQYLRLYLKLRDEMAMPFRFQNGIINSQKKNPVGLTGIQPLDSIIFSR